MFAPISREGALVLNNLFLSAATATVLLGTYYPEIREAISGQPISVGPPFFAMTFGPLMVVTLLIVPVGPLMAWKRGDLVGALQRLWAAAATPAPATAPTMKPVFLGAILYRPRPGARVVRTSTQ